MSENFTNDNTNSMDALFDASERFIQSYIIETFKELKWNPTVKNFSDKYAIYVYVPYDDVIPNINIDYKFCIGVIGSYNSPYYSIISSIPMPVHTREMVDASMPIVENLAKEIFGAKKDYKFAPCYDTNNMAINFEYTLLGLPSENDTDPFSWVDDILKTIQYECLLTHQFVSLVQNRGQTIPKQPNYSSSTSQNGGCYIATCVYGSYDCPQVWTLRRYRDNTLAKSWYGKAFIRTYYAISPTLVKWFGHTNWFKKLWVGTLNKTVESLQANGVESTPYEDTPW